MTESTITPSGPVRVEVFLRTHTSADVVERLRNLVARARRLEGNNVIVDVDVKTWASVRPALEELNDSGLSVSRIVNAFQAWADREGYTLRPAFTRRKTTSMLSHQSVAEIQVPVVCVAVYEGDTLQCVAPCTVGEQTYTVEDCLTALEAGIIHPFWGQTMLSQDRPAATLEEE